jgi:hypothetical protein
MWCQTKPPQNTKIVPGPLYLTATWNPSVWDTVAADATADCRTGSTNGRWASSANNTNNNNACAVAPAAPGMPSVNNLTHLPTCDTASRAARALHYAFDAEDAAPPATASDRGGGGGSLLSWIFGASSSGSDSDSDHGGPRGASSSGFDLRARVHALESVDLLPWFLSAYPLALVEVLLAAPPPPRAEGVVLPSNGSAGATRTVAHSIEQLWGGTGVERLLASLGADAHLALGVAQVWCDINTAQRHLGSEEEEEEEEGEEATTPGGASSSAFDLQTVCHQLAAEQASKEAGRTATATTTTTYTGPTMKQVIFIHSERVEVERR